MGNIRFEWDIKKDKTNQKKHGVSFAEAQTVFSDINAKVITDPDHSDEEEHFIILGMSRALRILVVCHCFRESDEVIRIITARKATKNEQENY